MILQGSCSELVCDIPLEDVTTNIEQVRDTLKLIEKITKKKVSLFFSDSNWALVIPINVKLVNVGLARVNEKDLEIFGKQGCFETKIGVFDPMKTLPKNVIDLLKKYEKKEKVFKTINKGLKYGFFGIYLFDAKKIKEFSNLKDNYLVPINITLAHNGLKLIINHNDQNCYKDFANVAYTFDDSTIYGSDGGSTTYFEEWLNSKECPKKLKKVIDLVLN